MSTSTPQRRSSTAARAKVFAALGDRTRLTLVGRLSGGQPSSIADLTRGTRLSRQAVTKHLHVLERAQLVRPKRVGRENLFELDPKPIHDLSEYLESVSRHWDAALARLKTFVEDNDDA